MRLLLLSAEETDGRTDTLMGAYGEEELTNLILKENQEGDGTDTDNTVEERARRISKT